MDENFVSVAKTKVAFTLKKNSSTTKKNYAESMGSLRPSLTVYNSVRISAESVPTYSTLTPLSGGGGRGR